MVMPVVDSTGVVAVVVVIVAIIVSLVRISCMFCDSNPSGAWFA